MAMTLIVKNPGGAAVKLPGTGLQIAAGSQDDYTGQTSSILKIASSKSVRSLVDAGTLVVNNGSTDLTKENANGYLDALWSTVTRQGIALLAPGYVSGARFAWVSAQAVKSGTPNELSVVADSEGNFPLVWTGELTADIAVAGPGGLQTGQAEAPNTWYQVLVIGASDGSQPVALLLVPEGVAFNQANYDIYRRVGWVRNGTPTGVDFVKFFQVGTGHGRRVQYDADGATLSVLSGGTATVFTPVDLSSLLPPGVGETWLRVGYTNNGAGGTASDRADFRPFGSTVPANQSMLKVKPGFVAPVRLVNIFPAAVQDRKVEYQLSRNTNTLSMHVIGYIDEI